MTGTFGGEGATREQRAGGLTSSGTNGGGRSNVFSSYCHVIRRFVWAATFLQNQRHFIFSPLGYLGVSGRDHLYSCRKESNVFDQEPSPVTYESTPVFDLHI